MNVATKIDDTLTDEVGRLQALLRLDAIDSPREQTLDRITLLAKQAFNADFAAIMLLDDTRAVLKSRVGIREKVVPRSMSFCDHTIRNRTPLLIEDTLDDARTRDNAMVLGAPHVRSYAGVPLKTRAGFNVGTLCVFGREPRRFGKRKVELLEELGRLVVDFMEMRTLATVDHLTSALNRRAFEAELQKDLLRLNRSGGSSVLAALDLDHFKRINDTFGHPCGDDVLRRVSQSLHQAMRETDRVGRIGGEEFSILLCGMAGQDGYDALERMRKAIADIRFPDQPDLRVTGSFGLVVLAPEMQAKEAMAKADAALYRAKAMGRNTSVL
jgi:diguanylate cyclase (GGDEF)-like protein